MKYTYHIEGMHCSSCIDKIKSALPSQIKVIKLTLNPPRLIIESVIPPKLHELNSRLALVGKYELIPETAIKQPIQPLPAEEKKPGLFAYYPIFLIAAYIMTVAFINNVHQNSIDWVSWMNQFMAGFFLVFSAFKLLDIRGFAEGYASYDLLARRWYTYGFIYPFLELGLGILYLGMWFPIVTYSLTIIIMGFSSLGIINSLLKKQQITCACLGTILKVPLSTITLIEDLTMVVLAAFSLLMY